MISVRIWTVPSVDRMMVSASYDGEASCTTAALFIAMPACVTLDVRDRLIAAFMWRPAHGGTQTIPVRR